MRKWWAAAAAVAMIALPRGLCAQEPVGEAPLEKSAYFAFVDREFIFTLEIVKPGVPLLNFISMVEEESLLEAKEVRLALETRRASPVFFVVDTGDPKEPILVPTMRIRPRSSFGISLRGEFGDAREVHAVTVGLGTYDYHLVPLTSFAFENLALKVNRINLGSPDFGDDWRVLKLERMGSRERVRRR